MKFLQLPMLWLAITLTLSACTGNQDSVVTSQVGGARQGKTLALARTVTTLAGPAPGAVDGSGTLARFERPTSLTSDGVNIYLADPGNHTIRKLVIATGEVTTLAGKPGVMGAADGSGAAARFYSPSGITTDGSNLYVADGMNCTIRKIVIASGEVTTVAGSAGSQGYADGTGTAARFGWLQGITTDGANLYVADETMIRKMDLATGAVTTLAGGPPQYVSTPTPGPAIVDGTGAAAKFGHLRGIATDGTNLFVTDNSTIRKVVITTADVTTLAGNASGNNYGVQDGVGAAAQFANVTGITTDGTSLYVTDSETVRQVVIATAQVSTLAGEPWKSGFADGTGAAARFNSPNGIVAAGADLFVGDSENRVIRKIAIATGAVTTAAGTPATGCADGPAATALFLNPVGVTTDGLNLFVADAGNYTIRKIEIATGTVTTLAGSPGQAGITDATGPAARFQYLQGITTDGASLYVTDSARVRKVEIATGVVTTLAGSTGKWAIIDGTGPDAGFSYARDITTDGTNLFVTDSSAIRKIVIATGVVTTLAGSATYGWADGTGAAATFGWQGGITTDGTSLFVADAGNGLIRKVTIATGQVTTLAGRPTHWGSTDGYGTEATFSSPQGITTDGTCLYIAESYGHSIRKLVLATGEVTTLVGSTARALAADGAGTAAGFALLQGITTDGRSLYVTDGIGLIRRID
jgi:hypothetical protein